MSKLLKRLTACRCEPASAERGNLSAVVNPTEVPSNSEPVSHYVYLLTNYNNTVVYTGVTNDLLRRVWEHREGLVPGFTKQYRVWKLVYFEETEDVQSAIFREKQLKAGSRRKKVELIEGANPTWRDLYSEFTTESKR